MLTQTRIWLMAGLVGLLVACGGGGGGNSAKGVEPGPPPPGGSVPPPDPEFPETNPSPYAEAEELFVTIKSVTLDSSQRAIVEWLLTDGNNVPIIDLGPRDVVLEVGTGLGSLTQFLARQAGHVVTLEIDSHVAALARDELSRFENVKLLEQDALKSKTFQVVSMSSNMTM